ncbi:MAG: glycoside hydrolase family 113, partial [Candidatus Bipolaricaulaceae bacterium]
MPAWPANEYARPETELPLSHIKAIGANSIAVVVTGYMDGPHATTIRKDPSKTPSDESLVHILRVARAHGLQVMLKPHGDIQDDTWRGSISPVSVEDWFSCYKLFIVHYARIAEKYGVELFCIGTEFRSLSGPECYRYWQDLIAAIRAVYSGRLTYAANWDEYPGVSFWNFLDYIGINAHFPLSEARTPSVEELVSSWSQVVTAVEAWQKTLQKPVLFTEIGYRSLDFAAREPWHWAKGASYNEVAQANAYEAAFRA